MDTLNYDTHNILLNGQPYPVNSVRPVYPTLAGDNAVSLLYPWWGNCYLWRGDVTRLINGVSVPAESLPFAGLGGIRVQQLKILMMIVPYTLPNFI